MQELLFGTGGGAGSSSYSLQKPQPVRPAASSAFSAFSAYIPGRAAKQSPSPPKVGPGQGRVREAGTGLARSSSLRASSATTSTRNWKGGIQ